MPTRNELRRLEDLFGSELGRNEYGEPIYKWVRAGEHKTVMVVTGKDGKMVVDWVKNAAGILEPKARTKWMKMAWWLDDSQWVLARWHREPKESWDSMYKGLLDWPARGWYYPCDDACLLKGEIPTLAITEQMIATIKKQRSFTMADFVAQSEDAIEREERLAESRRSDIIDDAMTAYGAIPGSRSGGVSFPTKESTKNHDTAFSS